MLALAPTLNEQFTTFANAALTGTILSDRERALAVLTTACALEDQSLIKQAVVCAKQVGLTNEEIGQTSAIVLAVRGKLLASLGQVTAPTATTLPTTQTKCCS